MIDSLLKAFGRSWAGTTPAEFEAQVREWTVTAKQPKLGVTYLDLVYKPMLELFELLQDNGFRVFVCSGGGRDFMRVFAEETWGVNKENVIGSAAEYTYTADGGIVREARNLRPVEPRARANRNTSSRRPGGCRCSPVGTPTSISRCSNPPRFALLINHDDAGPGIRLHHRPPRPPSPRPTSWAGPWSA